MTPITSKAKNAAEFIFLPFCSHASGIFSVVDFSITAVDSLDERVYAMVFPVSVQTRYAVPADQNTLCIYMPVQPAA